MSNSTSKKTFKVLIKFPECDSTITFAVVDNEDQAIGLALNLHKSSNLPHSIFVDTGSEVVLAVNLYDEIVCQ